MRASASTRGTRGGACGLVVLMLQACGGGDSRPNFPPVADAGADRSVNVGGWVTLDSSGSRDPEGDALAVRWTLMSRPIGSTAVLSAPTAVASTFVADVAGDYLVQLVVADRRSESAPDTVAITAIVPNSPPVADAGAPQKVRIGTLVELDGSASSDPDGDPLQYAWTLVATPPSSAAFLSAPATARPTLVADLAGDYQAALVVNDGAVDSVPSYVALIATLGKPGQGTWEITLATRDLDGDGRVDAFYDSVRNLTWLADANAAAGTSYDSTPQLPGDYPTTATDGRLYHADAMRWVANLDVHGVRGWRLPATVDALPSEAYPPPPSSSEMASLHYLTLGNGASSDTAPDNTGPFLNLSAVPYWSATQYTQLAGYPDRICWRFAFATGQQAGSVCDMSRYQGRGNALGAWAVHDGDVAPGVPAP